MTKRTAPIPGTLDVLILKAVCLGRPHDYGVVLWVELISGDALGTQQGALYAALYRLERQGLVESGWGRLANSRRAKFYRLTATGRHRRGEEEAGWERLVAAMTAALNAMPQEI